MTLQINIAGTDRAYAVRLVGSSGGEGFHTESAAMAGTVSSGLIEVEDPDGSLELLGWRGFNIVETTATPTRIATGFLANIDQTAGPFRVGPGRVHRCETVDLNWELTRIAIESGGKRPAETDLARVTWLLGNNSLSGRVYAGALTDLTNNPVNLGEADFTDEYPIDVLTDLCPVAGKTAYVTWDFSNNRAQLFYDLTNTTTFDSPAAISDGPGDADDSTVFAPRNDPVLHRVIEDGYSDIWLRYKNGLVHKHDATFQTDHGRRDLVLSTSRIGNPATADAYATKALNAHNHETTSLDCEVEVSAAHVNDILEGHRLYFKSTHLTGFTSYAYTRVEKRTVRQVDDQSRRFVIGLQLSDRVLSALPGGPPPSSFPKPPTDVDPDELGDVCNTVIEDSNRTGESDCDNGVLAVAGDEWYFEVYQTSHSAGAKITNLVLGSAGVTGATIFNLLSLWTAGEIGTGAGSPPLPLRSGTFTVGANGIGGPSVFHLRVDADYLGPGVTVDECFHIDMWRGSVHPEVCPAAGQWSTWQEVAMTTVGGVSTGTTVCPYAPFSLEVRVDGVPVSTSDVDEPDPGAGDFALTWEIDADETVTVRYQGI